MLFFNTKQKTNYANFKTLSSFSILLFLATIAFSPISKAASCKESLRNSTCKKEAAITIENLIVKAKDIQSQRISKGIRANQLGELVQNYFNFAYFAKYTMGRVWLEMNSKEQREYFEEFKKIGVRRYVRVLLMLDLSLYNVKLQSSAVQGRDYIMKMIITPIATKPKEVEKLLLKNATPLTVRLRWYNTSNAFKIVSFNVANIDSIIVDSDQLQSTYRNSGFEEVIKILKNIEA